MSTTFGDLRPQIQRNWGRSSVEAQSSILFYFNAAQRVLSRSFNFPELQKTKTFNFVTGDDDYDVTASPISLTDLRKIYSFTYVASSRGYTVEPVVALQWDKEVKPLIPTASNSYPRLYTKWGNNIDIYPPPADTYPVTWRYLAEPTVMVTTETVVDFAGMDEVLVLLTTALCFFSTEDVEMGTTHLKQAVGMLKMYGVEATFTQNLDIALGVKSGSLPQGEYWNNPFVRR